MFRESLGVLRKIKWFLPIDQRKQYYDAIIKQVMLCGETMWANHRNNRPRMRAW